MDELGALTCLLADTGGSSRASKKGTRVGELRACTPWGSSAEHRGAEVRLEICGAIDPGRNFSCPWRRRARLSREDARNASALRNNGRRKNYGCWLI